MAKFRTLTEPEYFKIIESVQAYPHLYDGQLTEYKDKGLTANIYENIASEIGIDGIAGIILFLFFYRMTSPSYFVHFWLYVYNSGT